MTVLNSLFVTDCNVFLYHLICFCMNVNFNKYYITIVLNAISFVWRTQNVDNNSRIIKFIRMNQ